MAERPADAVAYTQRLRAYLDAHPAFYGSAVALLDQAGIATVSPYVYRTADRYDTTDLATPSYDIEAQDWFTMPLAVSAGIWTAPYLDAGGGEIWMINRLSRRETTMGFSPSSPLICLWMHRSSDASIRRLPSSSIPHTHWRGAPREKQLTMELSRWPDGLAPVRTLLDPDSAQALNAEPSARNRILLSMPK